MNKIIITLVSFALCACANKNSVSEYSSWKGSSAYSPKIHNFSSYYSNLKNRKVIHKESFIGNFTLYYSPTKIDENTVVVPQVHCFSAELESTHPVAPTDEIKCKYSETIKYYAKNLAFFFNSEKAKEDSEIFNIAYKWYSQFGENQFITKIIEVENLYYIHSSGSGCAPSYRVIRNNLGDYIFEQEEVMICS
ncbi:hypothetical protein GCM10011613_20620 [Cellvibrio zantedeschiae]|uniref:Lipoprotein n=1 Tax=Cellvibrio zantedeschiae TaxID=1237077 RepID=A0ABQ3B2W4_9GAMM|nr:hypothetical protein [Cellvibrio zantedeschiae]GGY75017.1 hypothetical protein GCM10011613_20620 [Cellvibrio zantedeschiae]